MAFFPQIFEKQIKSINFGASYILYVRCHWSAGSSVQISRPDAQVKDLPWDDSGDFNFFESDNNKEDPDADDKLSRAIKNPITSDMVAAYRYWQPKDPVFETKGKVEDKKKWVIDFACYSAVINGFPNGQFGCTDDKDALEQIFYDDWFAAYGYPTDREAFRLTLSDGINLSVPPPPSEEFFRHPSWRAHEEPDGSFTDIHAEADAVMIFNVAKLRGAQKVDPITKKKPDDLSFTIGIPSNYDRDTTSAGLKIEVGLYRPSKPSVPPKAGEEDKRVNFPLVDKEVTGEMQFLVPDWEPWPQKGDHTMDIEVAGYSPDGKVRIKINFADKKPVVTLEAEGTPTS